MEKRAREQQPVFLPVLLFKVICSFVATQFLNGCCRWFFFILDLIVFVLMKWHISPWGFFALELTFFFPCQGREGDQWGSAKQNKIHTHNKIKRKRNSFILLPKACKIFNWQCKKKGQQIRKARPYIFSFSFFIPLALEMRIYSFAKWWASTSFSCIDERCS